MSDTRKDEVRKIVLENAKDNKIVIMGIEGLMSMDIDEFIKQPLDGILYDLNRSPEVIMTFIDDPKWVNDYAVYLVIKKLWELVNSTERR